MRGEREKTVRFLGEKNMCASVQSNKLWAEKLRFNTDLK